MDVFQRGKNLLRGQERWGLLLLLVLGLLTHLPGLSHPREVIFDEVHFGKFVTAYCCTHERFFDIHPPHAKLLIAATAYVSGYQGGHLFEHIGQPYGAISPLPLRFFPALTGVLLPLVLYWLLRELGVRPGGAFFGGLVAALDIALVVQTRIIALDGLLLLATFGSLAAYVAAERGLVRGRWFLFALLAGGLAGLAAGTKFTGLVAAGLILVLWCMHFATAGREKRRARATMAAVLAGSAAAVYFAGWALHFMLLQLPGDGDAWRVPDFSVGSLPVTFVRETWELHKLMLSANSGLSATHPNASAWHTWPLMAEPVFYWQYTPLGPVAAAGSIYFIGNPVIWWGGSFLFLVAVMSMVLTWAGQLWEQRRAGWAAAAAAGSAIARDPLVWLLIGFTASLLPLTSVTRVLFLYHYLTPLLFSLLFVVVWLERAGAIRAGGVRAQPLWYFLVLAAVAAGFIVFSPLAYGVVLPAELHDRLFWFSSWR